MQAWTTLVESNQHVERSSASVAAVSATKIIVFGGITIAGFCKNDGYLFDISNNELQPILGKETDIEFYTFTQTQWMGKLRFATLGINQNAFIHLVQLQFEKKNYAELRSQKKLGHLDRNDAEIEQETSEREQREAHRDLLMQQLQVLLQQPKADLELKQQLINELNTINEEDLIQKNYKNDIAKQIRQIDYKMKKAGTWKRELREKRIDLFNQYKRLQADIKAAKGKHEKFMKMISPETKDRPRLKR